MVFTTNSIMQQLLQHNYWFKKQFEGKILPSQLMPIASFVASIPGRNSSAKHELIFWAAQVPPLGSKSFYIEAYSIESNKRSIPVRKIRNNSTISNEARLKTLAYIYKLKDDITKCLNHRNFRWLWVKKQAWLHHWLYLERRKYRLINNSFGITVTVVKILPNQVQEFTLSTHLITGLFL